MTTLRISYSVIMLSVAFSYCYAECPYAECLYYECSYAECRYVESRGTFGLRGLD
jgi:hypothetical protein